jgi:hypothetical protein
LTMARSLRRLASATVCLAAVLAPTVTPDHASATTPVRVRVGTYNVSENSADGQVENGSTIAPWNNRVAGVVHYVAESDATIVAVQEAAGFVGGRCSYRQVGTRQVDDMVNRLGSKWRVAQTEVRPCLVGWKRTGVYIIYRNDVWSASGAGQWNVGTTSMPRYGVYQLLTQRVTGARLLFVSTHLLVGSGTSYDQARETETRNLISDATRYAAAHSRIPIIYAGDYNSHELHHPDGPAVAMRAAHNLDTLLVAPSVTNRKYDSANGYMRRPPAYGHSIDHVYVGTGVGVLAWHEWLDLYGGAFRGVIPSDHNLVTADVTVPR